MVLPTQGSGLGRVHIYSRTGVSLGIVKPSALTWTHSKSIDGSVLSFTVSAKEPAMVASPTMLEDALAIVELDVGGTWTPTATPYVLSPGTGTAIGPGGDGSYEFQPSGVGAAAGLCAEWLVLHAGGVVNRLGPAERYLGWQSLSYDASDTSVWHVADEVDPATDLVITDAKYGEPYGWPAVADSATWVYRDSSHGDSGRLTLFRFGSFTVTTEQKYIIGFTCDEEAKVYLDGPGYGGVILETSDQETGYTIKNIWTRVLAPGTYYVAAEMTTVNTPGGDGFDACRMYVATVNKKGGAKTVVLKSSAATTKVHRQPKTDVRPGFTCDEVIEILRAENSAWGIPSADLLTVLALDTMPEGEERVWPVFATNVAQVLSDLELDVRCDVDTSWNLTVEANPGDDLRGTFAVKPGANPPSSDMNTEGLGWSSDPVAGTRAVVLTNDGYVEVISTAAEAVTAPRGMYLESGASGSVAKGEQYAMDAIAQAGVVRRNYHADEAGVSGKVPFVNVHVCDKVNGRNYRKLAEDHMVLSITGTNQRNYASFSFEVGPF